MFVLFFISIQVKYVLHHSHFSIDIHASCFLKRFIKYNKRDACNCLDVRTIIYTQVFIRTTNTVYLLLV